MRTRRVFPVVGIAFFSFADQKAQLKADLETELSNLETQKPRSEGEKAYLDKNKARLKAELKADLETLKIAK
jgi:hypothetical protein